MESETSSRWVAYVLMLTSFFVVMIILDKVFGLHYTPIEPSINQKGKQPEKERTSGGHSASMVPLGEEIRSLADSAGLSEQELSTGEEYLVSYFEGIKKKHLTKQKVFLTTRPEQTS